MVLLGIVEEEVFAYPAGAADWAVEPGVLLKREAASGDLNPSLGYPVA